MRSLAAAKLSLPPHDFATDVERDLGEARRLAASLQTEKLLAGETLERFDRCFGLINDVAARASLCRSVHPDGEMQAAAEQAELAASQLESELQLDPLLFAAIDGLASEGLAEDAAYLLAKVRRDFRRAGVDRSDEVRQRITALRDELLRIGQEFDRNIRDDRKTIAVRPEELAGLPPDYVASHPPGEDGLCRISTDTPDYVPFITYADAAERRRELWLVYRQRAAANREVLPRLLQRRDELAKILDYPSWAAYATADKMIGSDGRAARFIDEVATGTKQRARADYERLLAEKQRREPDADPVWPWDAAYLHEKVTARECGFDAQAIRPYFELQRVLDGVLAVTARLFGVTYQRVEQPQPIWHDEVQVYDVTDGTNDLGRIYLDLFPRDGKYKHFAQFTLQSGVRDRLPSEGVLVCNFPRPTAGAPALLEHGQVRTLFHEFGHLLHHILGGRVRYALQSGVATEWDFVEAPSQLLEEWVWDLPTLQSFARHVDTGEPLPGDLLRRAAQAEHYGKGIWAAQQMYYAALSLELHRADPATLDAHALAARLQAEMTPYAPVDETWFEASFGHLNGYSALYYTYMWSLVIAKDFYERFRSDGEAASRYRRMVLEAGGSQPAMVLVERFLGRPLSTEAFFGWLAGAEKGAPTNP